MLKECLWVNEWVVQSNLALSHLGWAVKLAKFPCGAGRGWAPNWGLCLPPCPPLARGKGGWNWLRDPYLLIHFKGIKIGCVEVDEAAGQLSVEWAVRGGCVPSPCMGGGRGLPPSHWPNEGAGREPRKSLAEAREGPKVRGCSWRPEEAERRGTRWPQIAPFLESGRAWREPPSSGPLWTSQRDARNSEGFRPWARGWGVQD